MELFGKSTIDSEKSKKIFENINDQKLRFVASYYGMTLDEFIAQPNVQERLKETKYGQDERS